MKKIIIMALLLFLFSNKSFSNNINPKYDEDINRVFQEMINEIVSVKNTYAFRKQQIYLSVKDINRKLLTATNTDEKVNLLIQKDQLMEKLAEMENEELNKILKIRYLKGLSIIKLLYEKVLSLDHHFSSVATFREINNIANPNSYPEFIEVKDLIKEKSGKKKGLKLTKILGDNIYASTMDLLVNLLSADASSKEKEQELKKVDCIIDFSLRMNNDLNTVYFETAFLQKQNDKIKSDLESLFKDFTKPIKYFTSLKECRANDDWDMIRDKLNKYLEILDEATTNNNQGKVMKMQVNINFPIDQLVQFITKYNSFIDQGVSFYQKFKIILNSYEHEQQCSSRLPIQYSKLKKDVDVAIEKFNTAYKPVEINGSKLKEVLYGLNEYD